MPRITISYRRKDSGVITGRIFDRLAARYGRDAVFRDIDNIPPGVDFRRHIERVLEKTHVVLAIIGKYWCGPHASVSRIKETNDPVRIEIETALAKDKAVIPVLVMGGSMPVPDILPAELREFSYRNALRVNSDNDFEVHIDRLFRAIDSAIAPLEAAEKEQLRLAKIEERKRKLTALRRRLVIPFFLLVLALGAGRAWYIQHTPSTLTGDVVKATDLVVGQGTEAKPGMVVSITYTCRFQDGTNFDSSADRDNKPTSFVLGAKGVISGLHIGINGMKVGGIRILRIPPAQAYGMQDVHAPDGKVAIPANSTLIYEVKLIDAQAQ